MPLRIDPRLAWQIIDGEGIVVDLAGARTIGLNPTGALIWSLLADRDQEGLARAVSDRFDVSVETARDDVAAFLAALKDQGLLVEAP